MSRNKHSRSVQQVKKTLSVDFTETNNNVYDLKDENCNKIRVKSTSKRLEHSNRRGRFKINKLKHNVILQTFGFYAFVLWNGEDIEWVKVVDARDVSTLLNVDSVEQKITWKTIAQL